MDFELCHAVPCHFAKSGGLDSMAPSAHRAVRGRRRQVGSSDE
ncbi:MAG: hypothetical protein ABI621_03855 [Chloroflexota bacterium]